jgi:hypothetical protein
MAVSESVRDAIVAARGPSCEIAAKWRAGAEVRALERVFADCPLDGAEPAAERAERLFEDDGWVEALLAPLVAALADEPLFEPALKLRRDGVRVGAVLFECPSVSISASVTDAAALAALPPPETVTFSGRVTVTRYVRAGSATLRRWSAEPVATDFRAGEARPCAVLPPLALADGAVLRCDGRVQGQLIESARSDLVQIAATTRGGGAPFVRQYGIADGALARLASADERASRTEMLLAFLRLAGRADAGPQFEAATRDRAFHLRWGAMREWLALDAQAALPRLEAMAAHDPHAEVRAAATLTLVAVQRRIAEVRCPG